MKALLSLIFSILMNTFGWSQNILEALQLKNDLIGEYMAGELMPTDTITDLRNGYYEEFSSLDESNKTVVRQAALFHNHDGSRTLGISITEWDFVCFHNQTNFYEISRSKDRINTIRNDDILPALTIRDFVLGTNILSVLHKYLPDIQENHLNSDAAIDKLLSEIYHVTYKLPQRGTNLVATLGVCDYVPTDLDSIIAEDWSIIENDFTSIELAYDKARKKFKKPDEK